VPGTTRLSKLSGRQTAAAEAGARVEVRQPPDLLVQWRDEGREPTTEFLRSIALVARDFEAVAQEEQASPDARDVFDRQQPARRQQDADDQEDEQRAARHHGLAPDIGEGRIRR